MSGAAIAYAKTVAVKGSAKTLLEVIADLIPEGQTMTAPISMEDLTARMTGYGDAAARRALQRLVAIGVVRVVGGRRGQTSSYALPHLGGTPPPLPLLGAAAPPGARRARSRDAPTRADHPTPDGSADDAATRRTRHIVQNVRCGLPHIVQKVRCGAARLLKNVLNLVPFVRRWRSNSDPPARHIVQNVRGDRSNGEEPRTKGTRSALDQGPRGQAASLDRARDVRTHVHPVHTPARTDKNPTARNEAATVVAPIHPWHAWCAGRVHVPKTLHADFLQQLGRLAGDTDAAHEARLFAWYAAELATVPPDASVPVHDDFKFWRPRFAAMLAAVAQPSAPLPSADPNTEEAAAYVALFRAEIDARLTRRDFETWIKPLVVLPKGDDRVVLGAPSEIHATYVRKNFAEALEAATQGAFHCAAEVIVRPPARGVGRTSG